MRVNVSNIVLSLVLYIFCFNCHIILLFYLLHMCLLKCLLEKHTKCLSFCHKIYYKLLSLFSFIIFEFLSVICSLVLSIT